jgi:hypothetical protein
MTRTTLLSLAALALGVTACGGLSQTQLPVTSATTVSMPSATDLNTASAQPQEWGMPPLRPTSDGQ